MKLSKEFIAMFREEAKKAQWEINSWNGKSIDDLVVDYLERKELKPDDFTGAVVLNLHEAKAVLGAYQALAKIYDALEVPDAVECAQEAISTIVKRIEQVKGGEE